MKRSLACLLFLTTIAFVTAQDRKITGRIVDTSNEPIVGATVIMFSIDSTFLAATVANNEGYFEMPELGLPFKLQINHIAFEGKYLTLSTANVGNITLNENALQLDDLVVKAYRPIVQVEEGKLSYNVAQIASGTTATNVYEVLSQLPGVDDNDGTLQLAGAGAVSVIINGKPTSMNASQLKTMLRSMPIERVKSAEIMYSAPPQYGVRGAAINLVVERSHDYSYSGELQSGYNHQHKSSWGAGGSFLTSTPKWSADAMYGYNNFYSPQQSELATIHTVGSQTKSILQNEDMQSMGEQHIVRAAFDYTPSEKSFLSVAYNGDISPWTRSTAHSNGSFVKSVSDQQGDNAMHNVALRYKAKNGFDIGADYTSYNNNSKGYLNNRYADSTSSSFDVASGQSVSRFNFYTDMQHALNSGWGISYGAKSTYAKDQDFQRYSSIIGGVETLDTDSHLTEWSAELYSGFSKNLAKGSLSASLTGEYYNLESNERWALYPQASFMWMFNQNNIVQANVSSDKTYPSYWMLQNAISYVDGYTEIHGNPLLRPMREYTSQLIYIYKQRYIFVLFGSQTNDYFTQNAYLAPDRFALIYKSTNFDYSRQYGANIIVPFNIGSWLKSRATLTGVRMEQKSDDFFGTSFDRSIWLGVANLNNTIKLYKNLSLELNVVYQTPAIQGLFDLEQSWGVDAGLKLSLLDNELNLTAKCNDIFESRIPRVKQNWAGQTLDMYTGAYSRVISVNILYSIGGYTKKERKEIDSSRFGH